MDSHWRGRLQLAHWGLPVSSATQAFASIFVPWIRTSNILDIKDFFRMENVCAHCVQYAPAALVLRSWLGRACNSNIGPCTDIHLLCSLYRAEKLRGCSQYEQVMAPSLNGTLIPTSCTSTTSSRSQHESGTLVAEGIGTWIQWQTCDPGRVVALYAGAAERLQARWPNDVDDCTDSHDGSDTACRRKTATQNKVLAARSGWCGHMSYTVDFEGLPSSDDAIKQSMFLHKSRPVGESRPDVGLNAWIFL